MGSFEGGQELQVSTTSALRSPTALRLSRPFGTVVSRIFRTFSLAERHPALAHAVMAPLICWSLSSSMLRYLFVDHAVPAMWRSLAAASAFVLVLFPVSEHPPRSDAAVLLGDVLLVFLLGCRDRGNGDRDCEPVKLSGVPARGGSFLPRTEHRTPLRLSTPSAAGFYM